MLTVYYSDIFNLPLPADHRFPIDKYRLLREKLKSSSISSRLNLLAAPAANSAQLTLVHTNDYLTRVFSGDLTQLEQKRIGFPWSLEMVERSKRSTGATIAAAEMALVDHAAIHLAGGTHHGFADHGQGFCVFNDVAVSIRDLQSKQKIKNALVIDLDVHQGNGTAAIFQSDSSVFTFSMHGDKNFPFRKTNGDLDIGLPAGTEDETYLAELEHVLKEVIQWERYDLVYYLAGADPYIHDRLGKLHLSKEGLASRDRLVLNHCFDQQKRIVVTMAGGYAENIQDIVDINYQTVQILLEIYK